LTGGAVVSAAAADHDSHDGSGADAAGLAGARVDVMAELEEAGDAVCVDVVGDRGAAQLNGFGEDFHQCVAEAGELGARETAGVAGGADAGVEECFVGVDVADTVEERLVEERRFDGSFAIAEESDKVLEWDGEGFGAGPFVLCVRRDDGEAAEAARVYEAEFLDPMSAAAEGEDGVGVRG